MVAPSPATRSARPLPSAALKSLSSAPACISRLESWPSLSSSAATRSNSDCMRFWDASRLSRPSSPATIIGTRGTRRAIRPTPDIPPCRQDTPLRKLGQASMLPVAIEKATGCVR
eukprot:567021-Rhodomonas_salina.1